MPSQKLKGIEEDCIYLGKYLNGYTNKRCTTKFKLLLTSYIPALLEKAVFKLMQNLTSKLQFNVFLFSRIVVSSCSW